MWVICNHYTLCKRYLASEDFSVLGEGQGGGARINPLQIPRDDCIFTFK